MESQAIMQWLENVSTSAPYPEEHDGGFLNPDSYIITTGASSLDRTNISQVTAGLCTLAPECRLSNTGLFSLPPPSTSQSSKDIQPTSSNVHQGQVIKLDSNGHETTHLQNISNEGLFSCVNRTSSPYEKVLKGSPLPLHASDREMTLPSINVVGTQSRRRPLIKKSISSAVEYKLKGLIRSSTSPTPNSKSGHRYLSEEDMPKSTPVSPILSKKKVKEIDKPLRCYSHGDMRHIGYSKPLDLSSSGGSGSHLAEIGDFSDIVMPDYVDTSPKLSNSVDIQASNVAQFQGISVAEEINKTGVETEAFLLPPLKADKTNIVNQSKGEKKGSESHEEELLEILKKWYYQGFGEKGDLIRAMRLTGHRKSVDRLLLEGSEALGQESAEEIKVADAKSNPLSCHHGVLRKQKKMERSPSPDAVPISKILSAPTAMSTLLDRAQTFTYDTSDEVDVQPSLQPKFLSKKNPSQQSSSSIGTRSPFNRSGSITSQITHISAPGGMRRKGSLKVPIIEERSGSNPIHPMYRNPAKLQGHSLPFKKQEKGSRDLSKRFLFSEAVSLPQKPILLEEPSKLEED